MERMLIIFSRTDSMPPRQPIWIWGSLRSRRGEPKFLIISRVFLRSWSISMSTATTVTTIGLSIYLSISFLFEMSYNCRHYMFQSRVSSLLYFFSVFFFFFSLSLCFFPTCWVKRGHGVWLRQLRLWKGKGKLFCFLFFKGWCEVRPSLSTLKIIQLN